MAMTLEGLVDGVRDACGAHVVSVVLYGSAAGRDYHVSGADQNVLIVLDSATAEILRALGPISRKWVGSGNPVPLILTREEWLRRSDVFAIEYADLLERHRVLAGALSLEGVSVQRGDIRRQLESEAMGKLLRFRRGMMRAEGESHRLRDLLEESLPSLLALVRATLHMHGEPAPASTDAACVRAGALAQFDPAPFQSMLARRTGSARVADADLPALAAGYLGALERLVAHVDAYAVA